MNNEELITLAKEAQKNAFAPISGYRVGAAVLTKNGTVYTGVNVEDMSIPNLSICAERSAIISAISNGEREFEKIAIVGGRETLDSTVIPCGVCMQYLIDMCPNIKIVCYIDGKLKKETIDSFMKLKYIYKSENGGEHVN